MRKSSGGELLRPKGRSSSQNSAHELDRGAFPDSHALCQLAEQQDDGGQHDDVESWRGIGVIRRYVRDTSKAAICCGGS